MAAEVTLLLMDWRKGDKAALDRLLPLIYNELHKLAVSQLRKERAGHTLQATALIHEAYLRLIAQDLPDWKSRAHFFSIAAHLMRQILVDHARKHKAGKRGGDQQKASFDEAFHSNEKPANLIELDDALRTLEKVDHRKCQVIEMRYFGGLSVEETAEALQLSVATIGRDLRMAEAWLKREMTR